MNSAHVSESAISLHHLCGCLACCLQAKYDSLHVTVYTIILLCIETLPKKYIAITS